MSLFGKLFHKPRAESVVLINVGSSALSGAYAQYAEGALPKLLYAKHVPLETHEGEAPDVAIVRGLETLTTALITEGAPALQRATGTGTSDSILISVDAPWQTTALKLEKIEEAKPFTVTQRLINQKLAGAGAPAEGVLVDESLVGTILDGYDVHEPIGKKATRVSIVILVSAIAKQVAEAIAQVLRKAYHTKNIMLISGPSLRYQAVHAAFPLERSYLILDASGPEISLALVRHGLLVAVSEKPDGIPGDATWVAEVTAGLAELAKNYPLPHVIFLLAASGDAEKLSQILGSANLGAMWLSDNPPKIVALAPQHLTGLMAVEGEVPVDLIVSLMAIYGDKHLKSGHAL